MVGFQTKLKHGEQTRIFRMIPGLEKASFVRLGGIHRNTFLNSLAIARQRTQVKSPAPSSVCRTDHRCRGVCGKCCRRTVGGQNGGAGSFGRQFSPATDHDSARGIGQSPTEGADSDTFQPMNVNFGLFPPFENRIKGRERKKAHSDRALADLETWSVDSSPPTN